ERRHNIRIPVEVPITLLFEKDEKLKTKTTDFSEGGMAILLAKKPPAGPIKVQFTLPGTEVESQCGCEIAWQNVGKQAGIRFTDIAPEVHSRIKTWLAKLSPEFSAEKDPPVPCKLTDLSLGGCYTELPVPFPVRSKVLLSMKVAGLQLQVEGVVRVAHPEIGMGVEFTRKTEEQRKHVEDFLQSLMSNGGAVPELLVEPDGLEAP